MKVLVADDDRLSRRILEATLKPWGYDVITVADGQTAWETLQSPDSPRLAILDWMMPGIDGPEICRLVRKHVSPYPYLLLLTARDRREDLVAALEAGADDFLVKPFEHLELRARLRTGLRILELQDSLIAAREALRHQATHDALTGLLNRAAVLEALGRELDRSQRENREVALLLADLDHFKHVNDTFGHDGGDEVLRQAALRFTDSLRPYDLVARYGGEEFVVVAPGCPRDQALALAERIRRRMRDEEIPLTEGRKHRLTTSIGVVVAEPGEASGALVRRADHALYRAKSGGRDRVEEG
jgi:two-component system cell cycle response regulator